MSPKSRIIILSYVLVQVHKKNIKIRLHESDHGTWLSSLRPKPHPLSVVRASTAPPLLHSATMDYDVHTYITKYNNNKIRPYVCMYVLYITYVHTKHYVCICSVTNNTLVQVPMYNRKEMHFCVRSSEIGCYRTSLHIRFRS